MVKGLGGRVRRPGEKRQAQREQTSAKVHEARELVAKAKWEAEWPAELSQAEARLKGLAPAGVGASSSYFDDDDGDPVEVEHWLPARRAGFNMNGPRYTRLQTAPDVLRRQDDFPGLADKVVGRFPAPTAAPKSPNGYDPSRPDEVTPMWPPPMGADW